MAIEGVGCHAGKGGGGRFLKKERKERTRDVTVRPEIIRDVSAKINEQHKTLQRLVLK